MPITRMAKFLNHIKQAFRTDFDSQLPDRLVVPIASAEWVPHKDFPNPTRIGPLFDLPTRTIEVLVQEIPAGSASDMQRHAHESVHFVIEGTGYSEIGGRRCEWQTHDLVYTPVWAWHRHYNSGDTTARMLIVENSRLLDVLGLHQRQTAGLIGYAELRSNHPPCEKEQGS